MYIKKKIIAIFLLIFFLSIPGICNAKTTSIDYLQERITEILSVLKDDVFKEKPEKDQQEIIYSKLNTAFDFKVLSMLALGPNWRRFSKDEKDQFTHYFSRLITNLYFSKIKGEDIGDVKIDYLKSVDLKSKLKRSDVTTSLYHDGTQTPVIYRMMKKESKTWKIYDVLIEGVSLVANYRDSYRSRFNDSPKTIINEIKEKVEK